jgi:methylthioribose-1-phosphate isomerase
MIQTLEWTEQGVRFIDQTKLPTEETYVVCKTDEQVAEVIRTMVVRGAPAIGVAAAMGIALGMKNSHAQRVGELKQELDLICDNMGKTRPTAVNLFWAIRRMQEKFERLRVRPVAQIKQELIEEAKRMHAEDIAANQAMGRHGATLMPSEGGVLTHCNAGALATAGYGTWCDSRGGGSGQKDSRLRGRDSAVSAGVTVDGLGVDEGWHPDHRHFRQHGGRHDEAGQDWSHCGRRGSHRGQRRCGQ